MYSEKEVDNLRRETIVESGFYLALFDLSIKFNRKSTARLLGRRLEITAAV
jgi:hypothetical protein